MKMMDSRVYRWPQDLRSPRTKLALSMHELPYVVSKLPIDLDVSDLRVPGRPALGCSCAVSCDNPAMDLGNGSPERSHSGDQLLLS